MTNHPRTPLFFSLAVFACFAALALTALLFGGRVYQNIINLTEDGRDDRLCLSYLWTKIKNNDTAGGIYLCEFNGADALCMEERLDGKTYRTLIYPYEGRMYELFAEAGPAFAPQDGTPVLAVERLTFETRPNGLIQINVGRLSLSIAPRAPVEAPMNTEGRPAP